jgi:hypothetical protein
MNKDQRLIQEAYDSIQKSKPEWHTEEFYKILKTLEPDKIYSYKDIDLPEQYNHWIFTTDGKSAGIRKLGAQGTRVLTDYNGKQQAGLDKITGLVPSNMSVEEFKALDNKAQAGITQSVLSQRYSD